MIRMLGINGIEAVHGRVEAFGKDPDFAGRFDGVLARGLANLERLADLADQFLTPGAILFALKSPGAREEITRNLENRFAIAWDEYRLSDDGERRCLARLTPRHKKSS